jgi:hypothetical protein
VTIVDLTGVAIREIVAYPAVAAIAGEKVHPEWAEGEAPPAVIVESLGIDYSPLGRTRTAKLQGHTLVAKCFGGNRIQASQLGNAVAEAMNLRKARKDAQGRLVFLSVVSSGGNPALDPLTRWPFTSVIFTLVGAQGAVA